MGISLIKAPAGASTAITSEYAGIIIKFSELTYVPDNTEFIFNVGYSPSPITVTVTGINPKGYTDYDYIFSVIKPLFESQLGSDYNINVTLREIETPQRTCYLNIIAKNKGPLYNIESDNLPIFIGEIPDTNNLTFAEVLVEETITTSIKIFPVFAKNDYDFIFATNNYITNAGTKARTQFAVTGKPIATQTLILGNGIESFTFTFTNDPVEARTQLYKILSYTGSQTNQEQAVAIMEALQRVYYIDNTYNITQVTFISGTCIFRVEAKDYNTPPLQFTGGTVSFFATSGSVTTNVARAYAANYRLFLDVLTQSGTTYNKVAALDGVPNESQQVNYQELTRLLEPLVPAQIPTFLTTNKLIANNNLLKFKFKVCDYYGEPPTEKIYNLLPAEGYFIALGGAAAQKQITDNYLLPYFTGTPNKFLTTMQSGVSLLHYTQKQYISAFVPNGSGDSVTVILFAKLFYSDGTSSSDINVFDASHLRETLITATVGYGQININAIKDAAKTVTHYEVYLATAAGAFTERFKFKVDYDYHRNSRYFAFYNSFGQFEILWLRGEQTTSVDYTAISQDLSFTTRDETNNIYYGNKTDGDIFYETKHKIASGVRAKWELNYIKEFFASKHKFLVEGNKLIAITTGNIKLDLGGDNDTLFTYNFTYTPAAEERGNA